MVSAVVSLVTRLPTKCGSIEMMAGDVTAAAAAAAAWYCVAAHSLFGDKTCGALAGVIGSAGLRLIAVDEMVMDFMVSRLNQTHHVLILKWKKIKEHYYNCRKIKLGYHRINNDGIYSLFL